MPASRDEIGRGILFACAAVFLFSILNVLVKWQSDRYPLLEIVFFRSLFALVPCIFLLRGHPWQVLLTHHPWSHLIRSAIWFGSVLTSFASYHLLPLADAVSISFAAPLFLTALSVPLIGEKVGKYRWSAVLVGFLGVLVMVHPSGDVFKWGSLFALANAVFFAIGSLTVRGMSRTEPSVRIVFYTMALSTVLSGLAMPFVWVMPSALDMLALAGIGIGGGVGQLWMVQAYRFAPAAAIAPFTYTSLVWALAFGFVLWGDVPTEATLIGAAIVIASGLYILHRETRLAAARRIAAQAAAGAAAERPSD
jgi:drug/metabolite transporter (DMT)-like permease